MEAGHLHIILIVFILVALGFELYFMLQAQDAKNGLVTGITAQVTSLKNLF